jgi:hypothetical protein
MEGNDLDEEELDDELEDDDDGIDPDREHDGFYDD